MNSFSATLQKLNYRTTHCIQVYFLHIAPFAEGWQRYLSLEASGGDAPAVMMNIDYKQKLFPHARAEDETPRAPTTPLSLPKYGQRPRARGDRKKNTEWGSCSWWALPSSRSARASQTSSTCAPGHICPRLCPDNPAEETAPEEEPWRPSRRKCRC